MSETPVDEFIVARFNRDSKPSQHSPVAALEAAKKAWLETDEAERPEHIIVLFGRTAPNGASATSFYQAGSYAHHGMMGLCLEAMHMIRES